MAGDPALELCHCGRPLHYSRPEDERRMRKLVAELGPWITVTRTDGRRWKAQRHYIALHGIAAAELPTLGFEELPPCAI